jgi:hypothetical protein
MFKKLYLVGLVCCLLAPSSAFAEKGKLSFTPYMGAIAATSRDMVDSASLSVSDAQTWSDGSQLSAKFRADVKSQSFQDTHDTPLLTGFDIGYFIKDDLEVFGGFQYVQAGGNTTKAGDITAAFTFTDSGGSSTSVGATDTVNGTFDDYKSWALKVGATKYFPMQTFTTYAGGYAGFKHVDSMNVKLTLVTADVSGTIKFYDATNTGFFGFHTGANKEIDLGGTALIMGVRARLDYTPELNDNDSDTSLVTNGSGTNNAGGGVDFGLTAQLSIPF